MSPAHGKRRKAVGAKITTDGAMVFKKPSFESDVIAYLKMGLRVRVTIKMKAGFRKVKLPSGVIGYIRDEDIQREGASETVSNIPPPGTSESDVDDPLAQEDRADNEPFWMRRYAGPIIGIINYTESIQQKVQANITGFGLKLTGPDILIDGPLVDMNIVFSSGAPKYYSTATGNPASGFILIGDYRFLIPVTDSPSRFFYVATGPMVTYSSINVDTTDVNGDEVGLAMQQLNLGLTLGGGLAMRTGKVSFRGEINLHFEVNRFFTFFTAVQYEF